MALLRPRFSVLGLAAWACLAAACASTPSSCPDVSPARGDRSGPRVAGTARWPGDFVRALESSSRGRAFLARIGRRAGGSADVAVEMLGNGLEREVSAMARVAVDKTDCRLARAAEEVDDAPASLAASDRFVVMVLLDGWARRVTAVTTSSRGSEPLVERARRTAGASTSTPSDAWLELQFPIYYERAGRVLARLPG